MRIGILIRDAEYREALAEKLSLYDNDLYVNIIDNSNKDTSGNLILTDIKPDEIEPGTLNAIRPRTVFLVDTINGANGMDPVRAGTILPDFCRFAVSAIHIQQHAVLLWPDRSFTDEVGEY